MDLLDLWTSYKQTYGVGGVLRNRNYSNVVKKMVYEIAVSRLGPLRTSVASS
jgi:hypothetical protein